MPKAAKPHQEGAGWSMRRRVRGVELYVLGHPSAAAARKGMAAQLEAMTSGGKPKGLAAHRKKLAGETTRSDALRRRIAARARRPLEPSAAGPATYRHPTRLALNHDAQSLMGLGLSEATPNRTSRTRGRGVLGGAVRVES